MNLSTSSEADVEGTLPILLASLRVHSRIPKLRQPRRGPRLAGPNPPHRLRWMWRNEREKHVATALLQSFHFGVERAYFEIQDSALQ